VLTPAIYRTTITHNRQAPVQHSFEYRGYSWYVDIDELPSLPWWLRPFAQFDPRDHLAGRPGQSLRDRVDAYLADHDAELPGGRITALLQARVLGYVFNPISVFWCHDHEGVLRHVIAEVHNTYGQRHAYLMPPATKPVLVTKKLYVSPFNRVSGHYQVLAPRPDRQLDLRCETERHPPTGDAAPHHPNANALAAGTADGRVAHPYPRHRVVVAPSPGGTTDAGSR